MKSWRCGRPGTAIIVKVALTISVQLCSGLASEENGKIPVRVILIPVCRQKECELRAKQTMDAVLESGARACGLPPVRRRVLTLYATIAASKKKQLDPSRSAAAAKLLTTVADRARLQTGLPTNELAALFHARPRPSTYAAILGF